MRWASSLHVMALRDYNLMVSSLAVFRRTWSLLFSELLLAFRSWIFLVLYAYTQFFPGFEVRLCFIRFFFSHFSNIQHTDFQTI